MRNLPLALLLFIAVAVASCDPSSKSSNAKNSRDADAASESTSNESIATVMQEPDELGKPVGRPQADAAPVTVRFDPGDTARSRAVTFRLSGYVTDEDNGRLSGVKVLLVSSSDANLGETASDAWGEFTLETRAEPTSLAAATDLPTTDRSRMKIGFEYKGNAWGMLDPRGDFSQDGAICTIDLRRILLAEPLTPEQELAAEAARKAEFLEWSEGAGSK